MTAARFFKPRKPTLSEIEQMHKAALAGIKNNRIRRMRAYTFYRAAMADIPPAQWKKGKQRAEYYPCASEAGEAMKP